MTDITDADEYLDPTPDEAQLDLDREQAALDAEADRYEYFTSFADYFEAPRPLLVEQPGNRFTVAA